MSSTTTKTLTSEEQEHLMDFEVGRSAREALQSSAGSSWAAVETVLAWIRDKVKDYIIGRLANLPVVGQWASRIGVSVTEFIFTVIGTLFLMIKLAFTAPTFWKKAHETAMHAWDVNAANGLMAQTYAYSKKMAGYFLEVLKQCFERAIKAHGLEMSQDEKEGISSWLDELQI